MSETSELAQAVNAAASLRNVSIAQNPLKFMAESTEQVNASMQVWRISYINPTATSSTLSRKAKLLKLSQALEVPVRAPCSSS